MATVLKKNTRMVALAVKRGLAAKPSDGEGRSTVVIALPLQPAR